jgi:hypothetical protein
MPGPGKDRYHHGDLRAALIDTAAERAARATLALIEAGGCWPGGDGTFDDDGRSA